MANELEDLKGRAKEAAGDLTNNEDLERQGKVDQGKATVKDAVDKVGEKISNLTNRNK